MFAQASEMPAVFSRYCDGDGLAAGLVLGAAEDAGSLVAVARAGRAELAADADHASTRSGAGKERAVDGHRVAACRAEGCDVCQMGVPGAQLQATLTHDD